MATGAGATMFESVARAIGCSSDNWVATGQKDRRVLADLHVHLMLNDWNRTTPVGVRYPGLATVAEKFINKTEIDWMNCHRAGIDMLVSAHVNVFDEWLSMPTDPNPQAPANTHGMMDLLERELHGPARPYATLARNYIELRSLLDCPKTDPSFRMAVVHGIEGGHALGGDLNSLEPLAKRGVALICLTHFFNKGIASSANSYPYFPDANSRWPHAGLSEFGRDVLSEMERLGIPADVTHATATAMSDILRYARKPLVATHTSARTLGDHPYCLYDEHIEEIARGGGIIGVIVYPYILSNYATIHEAEKKGSLCDVVRTVRYLVNLLGSHRNIGIGSDFSGFIAGPKDMGKLSQIGRLRGLLLEEFGGDEAIVEDIMANNVIDFFMNNWRSGL